MDIFTVIVFGSIAAIFLIFLALGRWSGVRASDIAGRKQHKAWGAQAAIEDRDVGEMVEGQNVYRRRHGEDETTEGEVRASVGSEEAAKLDEADREMRERGR